ncbi:MAG: DUF488 domain-containing protein [Candidatus Baldrarchaeia archaeon]
MKEIFTIGHSTRSFEEFLSLLKKFKISILVDVRRFPTSRFEHFKKENLEEFLRREGIRYVYLGKKLGGYRTGGYKKYIETEEFMKGIKELEKIAGKGRTAIMCTERFPWKCHRKYISIVLEGRGWKVVHILDHEKVWIPKRK